MESTSTFTTASPRTDREIQGLNSLVTVDEPVTTTLLVLGDSVPHGNRTEATAWPRRLPSLVERVDGDRVTVRGGTGTTLAALAAEADQRIESVAESERIVALVHAGHNDAQLSGGDPRVSLEEFRTAAARLDERLAADPAVDRHAFVGLVPLLPGHDVPFADAHPERSLAYDDALEETVDTHLGVARPVTAWADRTADGVHPDGDGHAAVARRVAAWLAG